MSSPLPNLPSSTSPTLALAHPTPSELLSQCKRNGVAWRGALSLEAYLRREEVLSSQSLTKDGGITFWILIDTSETSSSRTVLAGCETYRKKALVAREGKVEDIISHGIGSVFCAPELRRRGYAARMMQELGRALEGWQTEKEGKECLFSVLYSDIGKEFYAAHGWEPFNSAHISVPASKNISISPSDLPTVRPLYEKDLEPLCQADESLVRASLSARPRTSNTAVALIPDIDTIRWHHAREDFVGQELHKKSPQIKGAMVGSEPGKRVWCYWTRMWYNNNPAESKGNTLHILRLVIEDEKLSDWEGSGTNHVNGAGSMKHEDSIAALLVMAWQQAKEWNMEEVEAWNPTSAMVNAARRLDPEAVVVDRDKESIASLRWFPKHEGCIAEKIDWIGNEKYGWC